MTRSTPAHAHTTKAWLGLALACLAACSPESGHTTQIVLQLATDLQPGAELSQVRVEVLDADGEETHAEQWFDTRSSCHTPDDRALVLGSLRLTQGREESLRLRITGYLRDAERRLHEVVQQRVDARFAQGRTLQFQWVLTRACYAPAESCAPGTTCEPLTGGCGDIPLLNALPALRQLERAADCIIPARSSDATITDSFDAGTLPDAEPERDHDVPLADAGDAGQSATDASWQMDVDAPDSADARPQTDAPPDAFSDVLTGCEEPLAICCSVDMSTAPEHCGGCGQTCSTRNITRACSAGACNGTCSEGFEDCNRDKRTDGCESDLSLPEHCGACDRKCTYGHCKERACEFKVSGIERPDSSMPIAAGTVLGTVIPVAVGRQVVSVGVWVDAALAGLEVGMAIYQDSLHVPYDPQALVRPTGVLPTRDEPSSGLTPIDGFVRVERKLTTPLEVEKFTTYWLFLWVSAETRIGTYKANAVSEWAQWTVPFTGFHEVINDYTYVDRQNLAVYLVSTATQ